MDVQIPTLRRILNVLPAFGLGGLISRFLACSSQVMLIRTKFVTLTVDQNTSRYVWQKVWNLVGLLTLLNINKKGVSNHRQANKVCVMFRSKPEKQHNQNAM